MNIGTATVGAAELRSLKLRAPKLTPLILVGVAISALWSVLAVMRLRALYGLGFDLGFYQQQVWLLSQGIGEGSLANLPMFADHFSPILLVFVPLADSPSLPYVMVIVQAVVFGVAVVQMGYALRVIAPRAVYWWSISFLALSPVVGYTLLYDFHPTVLGLPVLISALHLSSREASQWAQISVMLAAVAIREDLALLVAVIVLTGAGSRSLRKLSMWVAVMLAVGSAAYLSVGSAYLSRASEHPIQERYEWTMTLLFDPGTVDLSGVFTAYVPITLLIVFFPVLFLPLMIHLKAVLLAALNSAVHILAVFTPADSIYYQYHLFSVVLVAWAIGVAATRLTRTQAVERGRRVVIISVVCASFLGPLSVTQPPIEVWDRWVPHLVHEQHRRQMAALRLLVPPDASVSASSTLVPLFAQRKDIFGFPDPITCRARFTPSRGHTSYPDYVVLDLDRGESDSWLVAALGYRWIGSAGGAVLYEAPEQLPPPVKC